ncbi:MAG: hypothetical protein ABR559_07755, partial [Gemmatimonadota bacterium]
MSKVEFDLVAFDKASKAVLGAAESVDHLTNKVKRLDGMIARIQADADTRRADAALDSLSRKASLLDRTQVSVKVDGGKALTVLSLISAGLATIGHLAPAAVGALAAAPAAIGALAQGAGAALVAFRGVGDGVAALEAAEKGLAKGGEEAAAAQAQLAEELGDLTPEARSLAEEIHGEVLPALRSIKAGVQAAALPRFEVALRNLLNLTPEVNAGLSETGEVLGDLAVRGSAMMTTGPWRADFATIMRSNNRSLDDFGTAGLHALDATRSLTVAGGPLVERLAAATLRGAEMANTFVQVKRESGELDQFMDRAGDTLADFADDALQVVTGVVQIADALGPLGGIVLDVLAGFASFLGTLAQASPTLVRVAAGFLLASTVAVKLGTLITGLIVTLGTAKAGWLALASGASRGAAAVSTAAGALTVGKLAAQGAAEALGGTAAASDRAAASGSRFSNAMDRLGRTIPIAGAVLVGAGLAWDGLVISADEAAAAMLRGGAAADEARAKLQSQANAGWLPLVGALRNFVATEADATQAMQEQLAAMTPLEQAQARAAQAAADHGAKVKQFGPDSTEAKAAAAALAAAVNQEEQEQRQAADATKDHTDRLIELQNTMLAQVDKDLAFRGSLLAVEQAQKTLAEAVRDHGAASLEGREASLHYEEALFRSINALGEHVAAENQSKGATEANRLAVAAQKDEIFRLASAAGDAAPPALLRMAAGLSDAEFRARGATVSIDNLGNRVITLPSGKVITIDANTSPAHAAMAALINSYQGRTIIMRAAVDTGNIRSLGRAKGGIDVPGFASGAIAAMAGGGTLKSIRSVATIVPPNTPRLIGDRMTGNESFIPWDRSARSLAILEQTARAMGYALAPRHARSGGSLGMPSGSGLTDYVR